MESQAFRIIDILNNKIVINDEGMNRIKLVKGKVYPISMVGPMLTGKSSFINNLIGKQIFKVGNTTRSTTRGVNCYLQELKISKNEVWIAYLDIQGFDDPYNEGGQEIDKRLLSLLMSTSYLLLYNSFGALDSKIFSRIAHVRDSLGDSSEIFFIQRDFTLKLVNSQKQPLSSQEYLQRCLSSFRQKQNGFKDSKMFHDKLNCFLFPNHGDSAKYQSKLFSLKTYIHEKICLSWASGNMQKNCVKYFIKSLEIGVGLITESKDLKILQTAIKSQMQNEQKSMTALYKTQISQKVKKDIKVMFPIPEQLLTFKFKKISQQILQGLGINMIYVNEIIGQKSLEEIDVKILGKLLQENEAEIKKLIVEKIESKIECQANKQYKNNDEDELFQSLVHYHPFITETHRNFFMFQMFRNLYKRSLQQSKQNKRIANAQSKNMCALQSEFKENTKVSKEKQQIIEALKQKVRVLQGEIEMMKRKQDSQNNIPFVKQCSLEPKKCFSFQQIAEDKGRTSYQKHKINNVEQQRNKEKMIVLQKANMALNQELKNYLRGGNCVQTVLKNYYESMDKIQQKDRQMRDLCFDKDKVIQNLKQQNCHIKSINSSLNQQVSILRETTHDRTKTSHILQRLLKSKQLMLQQTQSQLLSNMSKYKEQINNQRLQNQCREMELSKQLSTFIIKNQDLIIRNGDLESKIIQCEQRVKKQYDDQMQEKVNEISNLHKQLIQCSKKLQQKTEESLEYSQNVENVLKSKDSQIKQMQLTLQKTQSDLLICQNQIETLKSMNQQKCQEYLKLELSKEQLEYKINRQQALANNKIKYIEQSNQKLKCQIKQKQNTFDSMLIQLRTNSLMKNSLPNKNLLNEERKERYMKKIDHLQEIALRELDDISNYSLSIAKKEKRQRQSFGGNRLIRQLEFGDMNHLQVRSKYETDRKPRRSEMIKSNHTGETSLLRNNLSSGHTMSTSSGFKTIAKRF